jgi:hypothetical protein
LISIKVDILLVILIKEFSMAKPEFLNATFDFSDGSAAIIDRDKMWTVIIPVKDNELFRMEVREPRLQGYINKARAMWMIKFVRKEFKLK